MFSITTTTTTTSTTTTTANNNDMISIIMSIISITIIMCMIMKFYISHMMSPAILVTDVNTTISIIHISYYRNRKCYRRCPG